MNQYSKKYIGYSIVWGFFISLFVAFYIASQTVSDEETTLFNEFSIYTGLIAFVIAFIVVIIYSILFYKTCRYELTDKEMIWYRGVIFKRKTVVLYEKIHAIDYRQNIIQRVFGIKTLSVDSGATTKAAMAEIKIVDDDTKIVNIEKMIREKMGQVKDSYTPNLEEEISHDTLYKYTGKLKAINAIFQSLLSLFIFAIGIVFCAITLSFIPRDNFNIGLIILIFIACLIGLYIVTFLSSYLYAGLRYYHYTVYKKDDYLIITHGLITKINHTLKLNRVKAIKIEEGFIRRLFHLVTIKLELVGFGSDANNNGQGLVNYFIPICKKDKVNYYLQEVFGDYKLADEMKVAAPRRSIKFFYGLPVIITSIIFVAFLPLVIYIDCTYLEVKPILFVYLMFFVLVYLLLFVNSYLQYKNSGIAIVDGKVVVFKGSFNKTQVIIPKKNIIQIETKTTYLRSKENITSYFIHFYNSASKNVEKSILLDNGYAQKLIELMRF